ncbi:helicase HerA domain-containing protein [Streptomyces coeruleofuscus]
MAAVQMDFVPSAVIPGHKLWTPAEPLAWGLELMDPEVSLANLGKSIGAFKSTRTKMESGLIDFQNRRLEQILSFLEAQSVDLCVFPEYAFITDPTTLRIFAGFAPRLTIVAGLGVPRSTGLAALANYTDDNVPQSANVAAVFDGTNCHLVAKRHAAEDEDLEQGSGPRVIEITKGGEVIQLGVAICKDYLVAGPSLGGHGQKPDVLAIPAFTGNLQAFKPDAPRDFPRILANHSRFGGSTVHASGCQDLFVRDGIPTPIPAAAEGILAVEWHGPSERPTPLLKKPNRVSLRSAMVSRTDGRAADVVRAFQELAQGTASAADGGEEEQRWLDYLRGKPRLTLIADALELYQQANDDDLLTPDMAKQLARHLLSPETHSVSEYRHRALSTISQQVQRLLSPDTDRAPETYQLLVKAAGKYYVESGNASPRSVLADGDDADGELRWHFSIGLGMYDSDNAVSTLSDQQDLLLTFARSAPPGSRITYRLETEEDPTTGNVAGRYSVNFFGPSDEGSRAYFESLQRITRSVFLGGWEAYTSKYTTIAGHRVVITPEQSVLPKIREDNGFLVDVMRAIGGGCALEISGLWAEESEQDIGPTVEKQTEATVELGSGEGVRWFAAQPSGDVKLGVQVVLTTPEPNAPLANLVGAALFGGDYKVTDADDTNMTAGVNYSVEVAHRILHPPHGRIQGRGLGRRRPLFLAMNDFAVLGEGAKIGTASAARPFVDDQQEVCVPDGSRLLHTYLVGRTGVGKTNTLKNIVRHDLGGGGPVIIVDPHGDLFDYAVRHATLRDPLITLDFTKDRVPSLNPIYLDAIDEEEVLANIEDLIEMMVAAQYYQWSGPRFDDLMRMCLHSLVAAADEDNGEWARIGDVPTLVEDLDYRDRVVGRLKRLGRTDLVRQWSLHDRMGESERAELEQWFISKFGDFRRPGVLSSSTSGKPSVNLDSMLRRAAAVLVKVPQIALGAASSKFLGSFIVKRVMRATMNGAFRGSETPAMLIVDEFQNFVGTSFATLIPEARKFNLGITLAHQTLGQLSTFSLHEGFPNEALAQTILGNVGNIIIHGVGWRDAERLAPEVGLTADELSRIAKYQGVVALTVNGERLDPFTAHMSNSGERPGAVAEAVALAQADQALERAAAEVRVPEIVRVEEAESNASDLDGEPPTPSPQDPFEVLRKAEAFLQDQKESASTFTGSALLGGRENDVGSSNAPDDETVHEEPPADAQQDSGEDTLGIL